MKQSGDRILVLKDEMERSRIGWWAKKRADASLCCASLFGIVCSIMVDVLAVYMEPHEALFTVFT